jgi:hypothetical protein
VTPRAAPLEGGYELWDGLADPQLAGAKCATVWMPELPSDTALVDAVSVGAGAGDVGTVVSVGTGVGVSVGVELSLTDGVGVDCAFGALEQLASGDGRADPVWPLVGTAPDGTDCPFRVGAWPPPPELPGPLLAGVPLGKSSSTRLSRTWARP